MEIIYTKTGRIIRHLKTPTGVLEVFEPLAQLKDELEREKIVEQENKQRKEHITSEINKCEKIVKGV